MTQYYPGPWEVEIFYVEGSKEHKQRLNCEILSSGAAGSPFSAFTVNTKANTGIPLDTALLAYLGVWRPFFAATTNFTIANLYQYITGTYDKIFKATYDVNLLGNGGGTAQLSHQTTFTFTTALGNGMRLTALDDQSTLQTRVPIRDAGVPANNLANYLTGNTGWIVARDGSFPVGRLNAIGGQNEALFKARNR